MKSEKPTELPKPTGTSTKKVTHPRRVLFIVLSIGLLLLAAAGGAVYYKSQTAPQDNSAEIADAIAREYELNKEIIMAQDGDMDGAVKLLLSEISAAETVSDKVLLYNKLGFVYISVQKYNEALDAAEKSIALENSAKSWEIIGISYRELGNKQMAIQAFEQAVSLTENQADDGRSDYYTYLTSLNELKEQQ